MSIGQQLLDVPFSDMVANLGMAIANAQKSLDENSIEILKMMGEDDTVSLPMVSVSYDSKKEKDGKTGIEVTDKEFKTSMIGAGFQPTFYQFAETVIEVKIAISMNQEATSESTSHNESKETKKSWRKSRANVSTVDATYSSKYSYSAEGSSLLRTRLVPVPPNTIIAQAIDMRSQAMNKIFQIESDRVAMEIETANNAYDTKHTSTPSPQIEVDNKETDQ